jgi:hypothetical protein
MNASDYVYTYLNFNSWVKDRFALTRVRNYLQSGLGTQSTNAKQAYSQLTSGLIKLLGLRAGSLLPATFEVEGDKYVATSLWRVYNGKGAPDEIQEALWLASLCGLVDPSTVSTYTDKNLGIDCGGFVANYWGMGHPTVANYNPTGATGFKPRTIWGMFPGFRRRKPSEIQVNDAAVFFKDVKSDNPDIAAQQKTDGSYDTSSGSQAFHIGLVSSVSVAAGTNLVTLDIAESSGALAESGGTGVNVRSLGTVNAIVANNLVYCPEGANRIYFIGRQGAPQPYMAYDYTA